MSSKRPRKIFRGQIFEDFEDSGNPAPASQGTNPEDSTVVPDGLDATAPVDLSGSLHSVAGPSAPRSPPRTPPRRTRGQKRKVPVVDSSTEESDNSDNELEAPPPTPDKYKFSSEEELKKKLKPRSSYVVFSHNGQCFPGIVDKIKGMSIKIKKMKMVQDPQTQMYIGRWEFPKSGDQWTGRAWAKYQDIKHLISPPHMVGSSTRPQYRVPKVDQYWLPGVTRL